MRSNQPALAHPSDNVREIHTFTPSKRRIYDDSERYATTRAEWRRKGAFFHSEDTAYLRFLIPPGKRILDLGCGAGETLSDLEPSYGVGVDFSPSLIEMARRTYRNSNLEFHIGDIENKETIEALHGPFDFILIVDTL